MFKWLKKLATKFMRKDKKKLPKRKTAKVPKCAKCRYVVKARNHGWYCKLKYSTVKNGHGYYASICGKQRVKTSPSWCPLQKGV